MAVLSLRFLSFLCCLLVIIIFISQASADESSQRYQYFCGYNNKGNYTANSTYHTNLNTLLSNLTSNTEIDYGFYNLSYGQNNDKVNAIGLCRGDIKPDACRGCLKDSIANLTQLCPNQKESIGWYEDEKCMLRYSDRSIFDTMETGPAYFMWNLQNATEVDQFNKVLKNLLESLRSKATSGDSHRKYATDNAAASNNQIIYGLAQCTPDLSALQCDNCLVQSIAEFPNCCNNRIGARVIRPSCSLRYEISRFYELTPDAPSPSPSPSPLPSLPPPPSTSTSVQDKDDTSRPTVAIVQLLLLLLCSFLSVSI